MPKVTLVSYTGDPDPWYAARLLAYTKNTRLNLDAGGFKEWMDKPQSEIQREMEYMAATIPSSWEFADLVFVMEGVSRATAQQVTRSRNASFAMQSQRVTDMSEVKWDVPTTASKYFNNIMQDALEGYQLELNEGTPLEDARDLLPMGVHSNIVAKYNLRSLVELTSKRDSLRVQGPYVEIVKAMKRETLRVWPWSRTFFESKYAKAIGMIEEVALLLRNEYAKDHPQAKELAMQLAKAADLIKAG